MSAGSEQISIAASADIEAADRLIASGNRAEAEGRLPQACAAYRAAIDAAPRYAPAHLNLGIGLEAAGDAEGALQSYERALALDPANPYVNYNLGKLLCARGDLERAERLLRCALESKPAFAEANVMLANLYDTQGKHRAAAAELEAALEHRPQYVGALCNYATVLGKMGRWNDAESALRRAVNALGGLPAQQERPADQGLRQDLADLLDKADVAQLESLFTGDLGEVYRVILKSGLNSELLSAEQRQRAQSLAAGLAGPQHKPDGFNLCQLLAYMLLAPAHQAPVPLQLEKIPAWFLDDYLGYILHAPKIFVEIGETEAYQRHMSAWVRLIHQRTRTAPADSLTNRVASHFAKKANYLPLYVSSSNTRELAEKRAAIMEFSLEQQGAALAATFPSRPKRGKKIKVGYLNAHFSDGTETYVTLPSIQLDRSKFEICLLLLIARGDPLEDYCRSLADEFIPLPQGLAEQVKKIRDAALDVIIIGTNVTAVTNQVSLLALHRLAPLQLVSYCSPVSTGMRHVDGYLSGTLADFEGAEEHFTEKLLLCDGPPGCLDYTVENRVPSSHFDRQSLGIADDAIVFVNAAACFKILPELQETWAKILAAVDNSRLLLLPFNPNWSDMFPAKQFTRTLGEAFRRHGLGGDRFILAGSLPSRADVKELEKVADVYLDTFPFSGSISVIDPLELGIPPAVWEGKTPRSRMAAALLRELDMPELIAQDEATYIKISVRLATDLEFRNQMKARILEGMARRPQFINPPAYGQQLGELIERLVLDKQA